MSTFFDAKTNFSCICTTRWVTAFFSNTMLTMKAEDHVRKQVRQKENAAKEINKGISVPALEVNRVSRWMVKYESSQVL